MDMNEAANFFKMECPKCGQSIECPIDGYDELISCPTCNSKIVARPIVIAPDHPSQQPSAPPLIEGGVLYSDSYVRVTKSRFIVGNQTFPIRAITSVQTVTVKPSFTAEIILILIGLGLVVSLHWAAVVIGLCMNGVTIYYAARKKATHMVGITTAAGEQRLLSSKSQEYIASIIDALNRAIEH